MKQDPLLQCENENCRHAFYAAAGSNCKKCRCNTEVKRGIAELKRREGKDESDKYDFTKRDKL